MTPRRIAQVLSAFAGVLTNPLACASTPTIVPSRIIPSITQQANQSGQAQASGTVPSNAYKIGGAVLPPMVVYSEEPKFPKPIRKGEVKGRVLLNLYVEANGRPSNVHVVRISLFDKKGKVIADPGSTPEGEDFAKAATYAVNQYRFKPGTKNGTPVKVEIDIEVNSPL